MTSHMQRLCRSADWGTINAVDNAGTFHVFTEWQVRFGLLTEVRHVEAEEGNALAWPWPRHHAIEPEGQQRKYAEWPPWMGMQYLGIICYRLRVASPIRTYSEGPFSARHGFSTGLHIRQCQEVWEACGLQISINHRG